MKNRGNDGQIVKHDAPMALVSCNNGFTELDNTKFQQLFNNCGVHLCLTEVES